MTGWDLHHVHDADKTEKLDEQPLKAADGESPDEIGGVAPDDDWSS